MDNAYTVTILFNPWNLAYNLNVYYYIPFCKNKSALISNYLQDNSK